MDQMFPLLVVAVLLLDGGEAAPSFLVPPARPLHHSRTVQRLCSVLVVFLTCLPETRLRPAPSSSRKCQAVLPPSSTVVTSMPPYRNSSTTVVTETMAELWYMCWTLVIGMTSMALPFILFSSSRFPAACRDDTRGDNVGGSMCFCFLTRYNSQTCGQGTFFDTCRWPCS